ncbi:MAG: ComF family protein [Rhodocyclaceae bacterium]|nr:ComF family protein [Rhodocyclaceae bacterium]
MSIFSRLSTGLNRWLTPLLPQACLLCGQDAGAPAVCAACQTDLPLLPLPCCPICATPLGHAATACGACLAKPPAFDATLATWQYAFPADRLVLMLKFNRRLASADFLAAGMLASTQPAGALKKHAGPSQVLLGPLGGERRAAAFAGGAIIVPVPLSAERLRMRGFNQSVEIARPLARALHLPLDVTSLVRTQDTAPQSTLPWRARQSNVRHAFACRADFSGKAVIVVDDVMTTGATLDAVARTLKDHGATYVVNWVAARAVKLAT